MHLSKNTVFCGKNSKITPKGYMGPHGPPMRWDKTRVFAKHACFYVFFAKWLEGGPWEGGKGGGIINPPLTRSSYVRQGRRIYGSKS